MIKSKKLGKKVIMVLVALMMLLETGVNLRMVYAAQQTQNTNIILWFDSWRPAISGNIRGQSMVQTRNANSNGIRARVFIRNYNSNGNFHSTTSGAWQQRFMADRSRTLYNGAEHWTGTLIGSTRFGWVRGYAQRRATGNNAAWGQELSRTSRTW